MKILYGKCFGLGNAVMAIPAIKALQSMGHDVSILIGTLPDDLGAKEVLGKLGLQVHYNWAPGEYDLAIMAIPFDGRWKNGTHFKSKEVMDGRTRPDPSTTGFVSWKKHETQYQMDNVQELGFRGEIPDTSFGNFIPPGPRKNKKIFLGVGYKKDQAGFWKVKHWGNENFAEFVDLCHKMVPTAQFIATGDLVDYQTVLHPLVRLTEVPIQVGITNFETAFQLLNDCDIYVGNDTGMMHVAASMGKKTLGLFFMENSFCKSHPLGPKAYGWECLDRKNISMEVLSLMTNLGFFND